MYAKDFKIGTKFKNKKTNAIITVIEINETFFFECYDWEDLWEYVDENLYVKIYE